MDRGSQSTKNAGLNVLVELEHSTQTNCEVIKLFCSTLRSAIIYLVTYAIIVLQLAYTLNLLSRESQSKCELGYSNVDP